MDKHGRCVHHSPPDTIDLKQMSSQLRRDQLRRREAGSRVWQEVTVGETGALVTEQRLHQKCPAVPTPLPPHSAGSHRRHNG